MPRRKPNQLVFINGSINEECYRRVISEFETALTNTKEGDDIRVYIDSPGGDSRTAIGIHDMLSCSTRLVHGIVLGRADSAAAVALQGCHRRSVSENSTIMLHMMSVSLGKMKVIDAETTIRDYKRLDELMIRLIADRAKRSFEEIANLIQKDCYFTAREAVEFGLADTVAK